MSTYTYKYTYTYIHTYLCASHVQHTAAYIQHLETELPLFEEDDEEEGIDVADLVSATA